MRDVGILIWVIFLVIGVVGSMVSSARRQVAARTEQETAPVTRQWQPPRQSTRAGGATSFASVQATPFAAQRAPSVARRGGARLRSGKCGTATAADHGRRAGPAAPHRSAPPRRLPEPPAPPDRASAAPGRINRGRVPVRDRA